LDNRLEHDFLEVGVSLTGPDRCWRKLVVGSQLTSLGRNSVIPHTHTDTCTPITQNCICTSTNTRAMQVLPPTPTHTCIMHTCIFWICLYLDGLKSGQSSYGVITKRWCRQWVPLWGKHDNSQRDNWNFVAMKSQHHILLKFWYIIFKMFRSLHGVLLKHPCFLPLTQTYSY